MLAAVVLYASRAGAQEVERFDVADCVRIAKLPAGTRPFPVAIIDSARRACGQPREQGLRGLLRRAPATWMAWWNSERASAVSDGPVWLGRGLTTAASAGIHGRWHFFSYSARPVAFYSQNKGYAPSRTRFPGAGEFGDPWYGTVDRPYRFGLVDFGRLLPGESFVRLDTRWLAAGLSNAAQIWGPGHIQPLMLSGNGGGFPHVFLESGLPINLWIAKVQGRWMAGRLDASGYGPAHPGTNRRLLVAATASVTPRFFPGLELGASRFFHLYDSTHRHNNTTWTLPISILVKNRIGGTENAVGQAGYNQLASLFVRFAPHAAPVEVYGEFLRDDHAVNTRDALVEPDHTGAYMFGVRRRRVVADVASTVTVEVSNGRISHLDQIRDQASPYEHTRILEGHTHRGMLLGGPAVLGGGGLAARWDRRSDRGGWGAGAAIIRVAQSEFEKGGVFNGSATGYYSLEAAREIVRAGQRRRFTLRFEPSFGDVPGFNTALGVHIIR